MRIWEITSGALFPCSVSVLPPHPPVHLLFSVLSTWSITNPGTWKPSLQNPCSSTQHTTQASQGIWVTRRPQPSGTMRQWPLTGTGHMPGSPGSKVTSTAMPRTQRPCHRQPPWTLCLREMSYEGSMGGLLPFRFPNGLLICLFQFLFVVIII